LRNGIFAFVFDSLRPVPVLSCAVRKLNAAAGIVITVSRKPAKYNGYKVYWEDGEQMSPERADKILELMKSTEYAEKTRIRISRRWLRRTSRNGPRVNWR